MRLTAITAVLLYLCLISLAQSDPWKVVDQALQQGVDTRCYPGCVALVGDEKGILYHKAFGSYTYGNGLALNDDTNPPMALDTLFDMASCTKVLAATSAVATLYQRGELDLNTKITHFLGQGFAANGKENITVLNCLLHNSGFPPDPSPNYWEKPFGCPQTSQPYPAEDFSCQAKIYQSLLDQKLQNPVGEVYVYSDLSFITLQYVVGNLARTLGYITKDQLVPGCDQGTPASDMCYYEAYTRLYVFQTLGLKNTNYLPPQNVWPNSAPCQNDSANHQYQNIQLQGQVSDGNAYALGGIAGHAGLFSNAVESFSIAHRIMFPNSYSDGKFLNETTTTYFTTEYDNAQSCRALGWSTNDPTADDEGWNLSCGNFSAKTWLHIGYTGTQVCGDPTRNIITVYLTNRVYPDSSSSQMHTYRQKFNNAVLEALESVGTETAGRETLRQLGTSHIPPQLLWKHPNQ